MYEEINRGYFTRTTVKEGIKPPCITAYNGMGCEHRCKPKDKGKCFFECLSRHEYDDFLAGICTDYDPFGPVKFYKDRIASMVRYSHESIVNYTKKYRKKTNEKWLEIAQFYGFDDERNFLKKAYADIGTMIGVGELCGVTASTISARMAKHHLEAKKTGGPNHGSFRSDLKNSEIKQMQQATNWPMVKLAKFFKCSSDTVKKALTGQRREKI